MSVSCLPAIVFKIHRMLKYLCIYPDLIMPFKFKDLVVTVIPRETRGSDVAGSGGSGGCGGCSDAGSASVGSCTSECGVQCFDSGEVMELTPYRWIDPAYQLELRQLLVYALTKSNVKTSKSLPVEELENLMQPRSLDEIEALEKELTSALEELRQQKQKFGKQASY